MRPIKAVALSEAHPSIPLNTSSLCSAPQWQGRAEDLFLLQQPLCHFAVDLLPESQWVDALHQAHYEYQTGLLF